MEHRIATTLYNKAKCREYLIRHIQHHAAQLGLRIQNLTGKELAWIEAAGYKKTEHTLSRSVSGIKEIENEWSE